MTSISVFLFAYGIQTTLFSTYQSLKIKSTAYASLTAVITESLAQLIYLPVVFTNIYMFGSNLEPNFFANLSEGKTSWEGYIIQFAFIIIIGCHIPFMFFCAKESFLTIIDELMRRTISKDME